MATNRSNIPNSVSKGPSKGAPAKGLKSSKAANTPTQKSINTASRMEDDEMAGMRAMEKAGKAKPANRYKKGGKVMAKGKKC